MIPLYLDNLIGYNKIITNFPVRNVGISKVKAITWLLLHFMVDSK